MNVIAFNAALPRFKGVDDHSGSPRRAPVNLPDTEPKNEEAPKEKATCGERLKFLGMAMVYPFVIQAPPEYDKRTKIGYRILAVAAWPVVLVSAVTNLFTGKRK